MTRLLTVEEVASLLGVNKFTVYDWLKVGIVKGKKIGRLWRIRRDSLNSLLGPEENDYVGGAE